MDIRGLRHMRIKAAACPFIRLWMPGSPPPRRQIPNPGSGGDVTTSLAEYGLIREYRGRWQYRESALGAWKTANSHESAVRFASETLESMPIHDRIPMSERIVRLVRAQNIALLERYARTSTEEAEARIQTIAGKLHALNRRYHAIDIHKWGTQRTASISSQIQRFCKERDDLRNVVALRRDAPDMHTEAPNTIHDAQTQGSQKCD